MGPYKLERLSSYNTPMYVYPARDDCLRWCCNFVELKTTLEPKQTTMGQKDQEGWNAAAYLASIPKLVETPVAERLPPIHRCEVSQFKLCIVYRVLLLLMIAYINDNTLLNYKYYYYYYTACTTSRTCTSTAVT